MLGRGIGVGDDARARLQVRDPVRDHHRAQCDAGVHRPIRKGVQHGAAVRPPPEPFELRDQLHRAHLRSAADRARGEARPEHLERRHPVAQLADDLRDEVRDVGEPLDLHVAGHVDGARLADAGEVVAAEVDEHHVLGAILLGGEQPLGVALGRLGRAGDRAEAGAAVLAGHEPLGRRADERDPVELEQEQVRRRVDTPQRPVDVERGGRGGPFGPLRGHALEDVAGDDVVLHLLHHLQVARPVGRAANRRSRAARLPAPGDPALQARPRSPLRLPRAPLRCRRRGRSGRASRRRRGGSRGSHGRPPEAAPWARGGRRGRRRGSRRSGARARPPRRSRRSGSRRPSTSCARAGPARRIRG